MKAYRGYARGAGVGDNRTLFFLKSSFDVTDNKSTFYSTLFFWGGGEGVLQKSTLCTLS